MDKDADPNVKEAGRQHIAALVKQGYEIYRVFAHLPADLDEDGRRSFTTIIDALRVEQLDAVSDVETAVTAMAAGENSSVVLPFWSKMIEAAAPNRPAMRAVCKNVMRWQALVADDCERRCEVLLVVLREYHGAAAKVIDAYLAGCEALDEADAGLFTDFALRFAGYLEAEVCVRLFTLVASVLAGSCGRSAVRALLEVMTEEQLNEQRAATGTLETMAKCTRSLTKPAWASFVGAVAHAARENLSSAHYLARHLPRVARRMDDAVAYMTVTERLVGSAGTGVMGFALRDLPALLVKEPETIMARVDVCCHISQAYGRMAGRDFLQRKANDAGGGR